MPRSPTSTGLTSRPAGPPSRPAPSPCASSTAAGPMTILRGGIRVMTFLFNTLDLPRGQPDDRHLEQPQHRSACGRRARQRALHPCCRATSTSSSRATSSMRTCPSGWPASAACSPTGSRGCSSCRRLLPTWLCACVGIDDPAWPLRDSLFRALRFNDGAVITDEYVWSRWDLLRIYEWKGIDPDAVIDWPVVGSPPRPSHRVLLRGSGLRRWRLRTAGCAFPGAEHDCEGDIFTDVFARWSRGQMTGPGDRPHGGELDDEDGGSRPSISRD